MDRKMIICFLALFVNKLSLQAMGWQVSIADVPQAVIWHIASFLNKQRDINALAATCRYLHATATQENKRIVMCLLPVQFYVEKRATGSVVEVIEQG